MAYNSRNYFNIWGKDKQNRNLLINSQKMSNLSAKKGIWHSNFRGHSSNFYEKKESEPRTFLYVSPLEMVSCETHTVTRLLGYDALW